ncbi:TRM11 family SAM-dependent methyltransferase [Carboxylicivirga sp. N1Y90]|uniref:TRM11 family SAM-dependent methyltransferase n=1 Tax=Carboxylicivirga fragile TaxID=3417571 RepID=UPI003D34C80A|nr:hypothetical protein [Marinilabiliaceae bacterium N1Y90]
MTQYLILQHPGHNRVYYNVAGELALAELQIAGSKFETPCRAVRLIEIAEIRYLSFEVESELSSNDIGVLSRLSFVFAIYKVLNIDGEECLKPIAIKDYAYVDAKISSLLKYPGKTNELFTKMMVNVALLSSNFNYDTNIQLLDPVAGRGTTLFEASVYGFNATGIEIESKSVHEATVFFKKFIQTERYKHQNDKRQISGNNKKEAIYVQEFEFAPTKEMFKIEELKRKLAYVNGSSQNVESYFKANTFHLIVGDLPYGIAHGNSSTHRSASITRNPSEMIEQCADGWFKVLKKGGVIVLAWNVFVAAKVKLEQILSSHGFEVLSEDPYANFEHMVDKSIKRDIIVARKI